MSKYHLLIAAYTVEELEAYFMWINDEYLAKDKTKFPNRDPACSEPLTISHYKKLVDIAASTFKKTIPKIHLCMNQFILCEEYQRLPHANSLL